MSSTVIIVLCVALFVLSGILVSLYTAVRIFQNTLYRSDKVIRTRACSDSSAPGQKEMFEIGIAWADKNRDLIDELQIQNKDLRLYGEYMNFGHQKCAIILQGRTESLLYSYYYADVYAKNGYNILTLDTRAHGLSDGKYLTAGVKEHEDLLLWIEHIKNQYAIKEFVLHGICIGAATAVYAACATKDPAIKGIVSDGLFVSYYEIFKNHIIERKKPVLYFVYLVFLYTYLLDGANMLKKTPYKHMQDIDIPILFLWSQKDIYCTPDKSLLLYDACQSPKKDMQFFPEGKHSYVRYCNTAEYDARIDQFLKSNFSASPHNEPLV